MLGGLTGGSSAEVCRQLGELYTEAKTTEQTALAATIAQVFMEFIAVVDLSRSEAEGYVPHFILDDLKIAHAHALPGSGSLLSHKNANEQWQIVGPHPDHQSLGSRPVL